MARENKITVVLTAVFIFSFLMGVIQGCAPETEAEYVAKTGVEILDTEKSSCCNTAHLAYVVGNTKILDEISAIDDVVLSYLRKYQYNNDLVEMKIKIVGKSGGACSGNTTVYYYLGEQIIGESDDLFKFTDFINLTSELSGFHYIKRNNQRMSTSVVDDDNEIKPQQEGKKL